LNVWLLQFLNQDFKVFSSNLRSRRWTNEVSTSCKCMHVFIHPLVKACVKVFLLILYSLQISLVAQWCIQRSVIHPIESGSPWPTFHASLISGQFFFIKTISNFTWHGYASRRVCRRSQTISISCFIDFIYIWS
jgi:hypothetical protein